MPRRIGWRFRGFRVSAGFITTKSDCWAAPFFFGPRTRVRTWGTRPITSAFPTKFKSCRDGAMVSHGLLVRDEFFWLKSSGLSFSLNERGKNRTSGAKALISPSLYGTVENHRP